MTEHAGWQFELEIHPPDWRFLSGKSWIAGWIRAPDNGRLSDLRAWIDGRPFLGLHGLPRPGLDERFLQRPGPPYHGFSFLLEPAAGARLLRLEVRDQAGAWQEIHRQTISVAGDTPAAPPTPAASDLLARALPDLLRKHAQRPQMALARLADEMVSSLVAVPLNSLPNPPFHGALEEPGANGWLRYGRLSVTGWLAHRERQITRITAMVDPEHEGSLLHGLPRKDVDGLFPDLPGRDTSAFVGHIDLPSETASPALLKIFAELDNGEKHLAFAQRFTPRATSGADRPLPPLSRLTFARGVWAFLGAAKRHGLARGKWQQLKPAIRSAWNAYAAESPGRPGHARLAALPPVVPGDNRPLRLLVFTHNLNFEGAPWFIFELARYFSRLPGTSVRVVSPEEGPLRRVFEEAGMPVEVLDVSGTLKAATPEDFQAALDRATRTLPWKETDLVITNTMVTFWAVHAARQAGLPVMMYVHESAPVRRFFEPLVSLELFPIVEAAFREASRVVFTAESTRAVFDYLGHRGNFALLPSWVDVSRVDDFARRHARADLRRKHGLDPGAVLVVNIGSVCERKGQHVFIRALDLLKGELPALHPDAKINFLMVGARPGIYLESLKQEIRRFGLENASFLPETGEIFDFYRLADVFVCSSFEESFPRVLLESATFGLPIITTNVNGIPEMLAPDEAWFTPAGDHFRLAEALRLALSAHFAGDCTRAGKARASVLRKYHEANSLPRHAALARSLVKS
jgi:glycosyltransferase involved in cell wall biosynthesis